MQSPRLCHTLPPAHPHAARGTQESQIFSETGALLRVRNTSQSGVALCGGLAMSLPFLLHGPGSGVLLRLWEGLGECDGTRPRRAALAFPFLFPGVLWGHSPAPSPGRAGWVPSYRIPETGSWGPQKSPQLRVASTQQQAQCHPRHQAQKLGVLRRDRPWARVHIGEVLRTGPRGPWATKAPPLLFPLPLVLRARLSTFLLMLLPSP